MEELIFKYLNKELSREEWEELQEWVKKESLNKTILNKLHAYSMVGDHESDKMKELIWSELKSRGNISERPVMHHEKRTNTSLYFKIAASVLLILTATTLAYIYSSNQQFEDKAVSIELVENEVPYGSKLITRLPDGTTVTLNAGSILIYPDQFTGKNREVRLAGEGFFEVTHDPDKPFIVKFKEDEVRVLGTSFNVRSYEDERSSCVTVASGKVSFTSATGEQAMLTPDQMATYSEVDKKLIIEKVDGLQAFGWKDRIIYFKNKPFPEIITELERWYGVSIVVNGDFEKIGTFSGQFEDSTLHQVLKGLSFVYKFNYKIEGNQVTLNTID